MPKVASKQSGRTAINLRLRDRATLRQRCGNDKAGTILPYGHQLALEKFQAILSQLWAFQSCCALVHAHLKVTGKTIVKHTLTSPPCNGRLLPGRMRYQPTYKNTYNPAKALADSHGLHRGVNSPVMTLSCIGNLQLTSTEQHAQDGMQRRFPCLKMLYIYMPPSWTM